MRNMTFDDLSCEEVFELDAVCDEWLNEAIEAQEADMAEVDCRHVDRSI